jgi:hypothetical protein
MVAIILGAVIFSALCLDAHAAQAQAETTITLSTEQRVFLLQRPDHGRFSVEDG